MTLNKFHSPLNPNGPLDQNDLIVDIEEQINYLIESGLKVEDKNELKHIIENYGFNKLFRKYSKPFIIKENNNFIFKPNTTEVSIIKLYYFDYFLTNLLINFLGSLETKITGNIVFDLNLECPDPTAQLQYLWPSAKQQKNLIRNVQNASEDGSDYLKPFIEANIYPGWIILSEMTLGQKMQSFLKLKNVDNILENFYLTDFDKKDFYHIIFDFIRPFRNVSAHFDRLLKFIVNIDQQQISLFHNLITKIIINPEYVQEVLVINNQTINSFGLIVIAVYLLGYSRACSFVRDLKIFINDYQISEVQYFNVEEFLIDKKIYNWPINWKVILDLVLENKKNNDEILINDQMKTNHLNKTN